MKATVFAQNRLIGAMELQIGDATMGCVYGEFTPNEIYFSDIQKHVWAFWASNKPDDAKWNALNFEVQLENGYVLKPEGGFTFDDIPEFPETPIRIDIAGLDIEVLKHLAL